MSAPLTAPLIRHRPFQLYLGGRALAAFASQMVGVIVAWQLYELTDSAFLLGMIGLAQFIPTALLIFIAGHVADRYDRKRVVQLCQFGEARSERCSRSCWFSASGRRFPARPALP